MDFQRYQQALARGPRGAECPFPEPELQQRLARLHVLMSEERLDSLVVTDPADIYYLTGYCTFEVSVHVALVVGPSSLVLQVPSIEMGAAMATSRVDRVMGYRWEGVAMVLDPLADELRVHGPRIGIDFWHGSLRQGVVEGLLQRLDNCQLVDAGRLLDQTRIVKSEFELDCLRESARITELGLEAAVRAVAVGARDNAVAAAGAEAMLAAGSEFMSMQPIVSTGARSSVIHTTHRRHVIEAGDPVFLEFGAAYHRYTAPMMRTVVAGCPTHAMRDVFDGCRRLFDALSAAMKAGQTFHSAALAGEQALAPLVDRVFFSGVFGYTVGAQFPPSWVEGSGFIARDSMAVFQEDMVFHLPICLRVPGQWGIGCSDTVRVTIGGAEPLTANPWVLTGSG